MGLLTRMRKQNALWWKPDGAQDTYGKPTYAAPEEIKVRWEGMTKEHRTAENTVPECSDTVFVGIDIEVGDLLWPGSLDEFPSEFLANPPAGGAVEVTSVETVPKLNNRESLRIAYC